MASRLPLEGVIEVALLLARVAGLAELVPARVPERLEPVPDARVGVVMSHFGVSMMCASASWPGDPRCTPWQRRCSGPARSSRARRGRAGLTTGTSTGLIVEVTADPAAVPSGGYGLVTLLTDYGSSGGFVGALHVVIDAILAGHGRHDVRIVDLDHSIPPQDVLLGALRMERMQRYMRAGVHVGVVDPGVGTGRRALAIAAGTGVFVGPDNGLLLFAAEAAGGIEEVVSLERHRLDHPAATFDGRDLFAPAAAHLAAGMALAELGPSVDPATLVRLERPAPQRREGGELALVVVQIDGFGNVQFAAGPEVLGSAGGPGTVLELSAGGHRLAVTAGRTFGDVAPGQPVLLVDSDGCLALSVNRGRADRLLGGLHAYDVVQLAPDRD
jgi:S-adenosylmethionine hydrolase